MEAVHKDSPEAVTRGVLLSGVAAAFSAILPILGSMRSPGSAAAQYKALLTPRAFPDSTGLGGGLFLEADESCRAVNLTLD